MQVVQRYRVVVADDDLDVRTLARRYLERSGRFTVVAEAVDGDEAVSAAETHQPDLTLLDLNMPDTDGLTALPLIRTVAPACTVVVLSGFDRSDIRDDALAAGATSFLTKHRAWQELAGDLVGVLEAVEQPADAQRSLDLPGALTSGHHARRWLRDTLESWRLHELVGDAELLTSELINNAVVHAASGVRVRVRLLDGRVRVEVSDSGPGALHRQETTVEDTSGRGLFLVEALSSAWGTSAGRGRKMVWFELQPGAVP